MRNSMRLDTPMLFFFACVVATQVSCSSDTTTNPGPPVAAITVALDASLLSVGHTAQASATVKDSAGNAIDGQTVSWASQDTGVAKVSAEGAVTAVAAGSTVIQGKISGKIGGAPLTVVGPANLAFNSFNNGSLTGELGTFQFLYQPGRFTIVDDPTGSGRGKVGQFFYLPTSSNISDDEVINPSGATIPTFRYGYTIWFKGDVYFPSANSSGQGRNFSTRKFLDFKGSPDTRMVLYRARYANDGSGTVNDQTPSWTHSDIGLSVHMSGILPNQAIETHCPPLLDDVWNTVEVMVKTNSADGVADGVVEIYINNSSATPDYRLATGLQWIGESSVTPSNFNFLMIGSQLTDVGYPGIPLFSEYRYWDNVSFSTTRIGR